MYAIAMHHAQLATIVLASCLCAAKPTLTESTIVSIFGTSRKPAAADSVVWEDVLFIKDKKFKCSLSDDPMMNRGRALINDFRSRMATLEGVCVTNEIGVVLCVNDHVTVGGTKYTVSEDAIHGELGDQVFVDSSKEPRVIVTCLAPSIVHVVDPIPKKTCRVGDLVGNNLVVTNVYSNNSVIVDYVEKPLNVNDPTATEGVDCSHTGFLDNNSLIRIVTATLISGITKIVIESPLCENNSNYMQLLHGGCWTGEFFQRQFDYCIGQDKQSASFRFLQLINRVNQRWPASLSLGATITEDWNLDPETRSLTATYVTDTACKDIHAAMTEDYLVTGVGRRLSLRAVSGPFSPMRFHPRSDYVEGMVVVDPDDPTGCAGSSWSNLNLFPSNEPWIALVDRGSCMFQDKALLAQAKGAVGVIIVNSRKKFMIPAMASVSGKPVLDIPTVLTDIDGAVLKQLVGEKVRITPSGPIGDSPPLDNDKLSVKVNIGCSSTNPGFSKPCEVGDQVLVQFDGDQIKHHGRITEKHSPDTYMVTIQGNAPAIFPGWQLFKDSNKPCTAHRGTFIESVKRTDTCEISIDMHSGVLCGYPQFREPLLRKNDISCTLVEK